MAFAFACKRAPLAVAGLLNNLLRAAQSASASPLRSAHAQPQRALSLPAASSAGGAPSSRDGVDSEQECSGDEDVASDLFRSRGFSLPLSPDTKAIFGEPVCMGRLLKVAAGEAAARGCCGCWVLTEDADAVKLKVAMPGLGKEHVKVWAEQDDLVVEADGVRDPDFDDDHEDPARYRYRMAFPKDALKMDQIKAEMKDGALKVTVPKIKLEEERTDVFEAKIKREDEESTGLYGISRNPGG